MQSLFDFRPFIPDVLGIVGVLIILWYYFLLQVGKCAASSLRFSVGNFVGAILLLISLWYNWNLSSVIIEIAWCLISAYGIVRYYSHSKVQQ
jgi:hypothetical protein